MAQQKKIMDLPKEESTEDRNAERMRITETHIGDTLYIVESVQSTEATETVRSKLKRLILNNAANS